MAMNSIMRYSVNIAPKQKTGHSGGDFFLLQDFICAVQGSSSADDRCLLRRDVNKRRAGKPSHLR